MSSRQLTTLGIFCALATFPAHGSLIGDTVSSTLHTAAAGSWTNATAVVGAGIEFSQTYNSCNAGPCETISLDIGATTFTLRFQNDFPGSANNTEGSFNLGLLGFEFTDVNQIFTNVIFAGSTGGFPVNSITNTTVTANTIHIFLNSPIIPGKGTVWTATWNFDATAAAVDLPEPASIALTALGAAALFLRRRRATI